jgi:hypothetical protein
MRAERRTAAENQSTGSVVLNQNGHTQLNVYGRFGDDLSEQ